MGKIMRPGRVVVVLNGRYAGRKGVLIRNYDEGTSEKSFGHAVVAGVDRYPRKVTRHMSKAKVTRRIKMKPFLKVLNYRHLMPTRYVMSTDFEKSVATKDLKDPAKRKKARFVVKTKFAERYAAGKNRWFFKKLKF